MLDACKQPYVFIIEEDEAVCDSLTMALQSVGLVCQTFKNTESFFRTFKQGFSGCIVVDNNLTGLKSLELKADFIRRDIHLPIIFLTSYGDNSKFANSMLVGTGTDLYIKKPFHIEMLAENIYALMHNGAK